MSFKKTLALCLSLLILGGCAITGTLAFPNLFSVTDEQEGTGDTGTQTPNVEIRLNIVQDGEALMYPGKPLQKEVSITNKEVSTESVYVWYTFSVPKVLVEPINSRPPLVFNFAEDNAWTYNSVGVEKGNSIVYTCLYEAPLEPGECTAPSLESVTLDEHIDCEPDGSFVWWEDGVSTPVGYSCGTGRNVEISFNACAISTTGFGTVQQAYDAYYNQSSGESTTDEVSAE